MSGSVTARSADQADLHPGDPAAATPAIGAAGPHAAALLHALRRGRCVDSEQVASLARLVRAHGGVAFEHQGSYLCGQYFRLRARRGPKKAILPVAASMLTAIYHMLRRGVPYHDLTESYFHRLDRTKLATRLIRRLRELDLEVEVRPLPNP